MTNMRSFAIVFWPLGVFAAIAIVTTACPPTAPAANIPDATDAIAPPGPPPALDASVADCTTACDAMKRVGCKVLPDCARVLCLINNDPRFKHNDLGCLSRVLAPSDVWVCGTDCKVQ